MATNNCTWDVCKSHCNGVYLTISPRLQLSKVADYSQLIYIPQMEQHLPEERMLFCVGSVTYLLDVTTSNLMPYPLSLPPIFSSFVQVPRFGC